MGLLDLLESQSFNKFLFVCCDSFHGRGGGGGVLYGLLTYPQDHGTGEHTTPARQRTVEMSLHPRGP